MTKIKMMIWVGAILWAGTCVSATRVCAQNGGAAEEAGPYESLEIRGVTVIDGSGAPAYGPVNIFIKGNRIERIVSEDAIARMRKAAGAADAKVEKAPDRVIEGKGMYVTPGLIDVHIHVNESKDVPAEYIYKLLLGHGVTTIRTFNIGNDTPAQMVAEKKRSAENKIIAPRMYVYPFWGRGNDPRFFHADGARQVVDE